MDHRVRRALLARDDASPLRPALVRPHARAQPTFHETPPHYFALAALLRRALGVPGLGLRDRRRLDPAGLDACVHDHGVGLLARDVEAVEIARMLLGLAVGPIRPTDE